MDFPDLRSASIPSKRAKNRKQKYQNFRVVNTGQLNAPHYDVKGAVSAPSFLWGWGWRPADISECPIVPLSKQDFYHEAQMTGIPRHHHRCADKKRKWSIKAANAKRSIVKEEAASWNLRGCHITYVTWSPSAFHCADTFTYDSEDIWHCPWCHWQEMEARKSVPIPRAVEFDLGGLVDDALNRWEEAQISIKDMDEWIDVDPSEVPSSPALSWVDLDTDSDDFEEI